MERLDWECGFNTGGGYNTLASKERNLIPVEVLNDVVVLDEECAADGGEV